LTAARPQKRALRRAAGVLSAFAGLLLAWLFFYYAGRVLILLPSAIHEGTEWQP
jgi:hypothetical protein